MDQEVRDKIDQIEALKGNMYCTKCDTYVKSYVVCKVEEDFEKCPRLRSPKEYKDECPYCKKKVDNYLSLGGHMVTCELNPKQNKRNEKISESHKGLKQSEECKSKIAASMRKYHEKVNSEEEEEIHQEIVVDDKKIDIKFY